MMSKSEQLRVACRKGKEAGASGVEKDNPYTASQFFVAWRMGYDVGRGAKTEAEYEETIAHNVARRGEEPPASYLWSRP